MVEEIATFTNIPDAVKGREGHFEPRGNQPQMAQRVEAATKPNSIQIRQEDAEWRSFKNGLGLERVSYVAPLGSPQRRFRSFDSR